MDADTYKCCNCIYFNCNCKCDDCINNLGYYFTTLNDDHSKCKCVLIEKQTAYMSNYKIFLNDTRCCENYKSKI